MREVAWKVAIVVVLTSGAARSAPETVDKRAEQPTLVGRWRVVGCATSPRDPADCARGHVVFEAKRWSVELPCCKRASAYVVVSTASDRIKIASEGVESEIRLDADGTARWNPGFGGRVGTISFVREGARK